MDTPQDPAAQRLAGHVGQRMRALRVARNISQEQLGDLAALHRTFIGRVERGETNITVYSLMRICEALDVSLAEFFRPLVRED